MKFTKTSSLFTQLVSRAVLASAMVSMPAYASVVSTFDDLALAPESFFDPQAPATFTSGNATFTHNSTDFGSFRSWDGFTYSNTTDTTTPGFLNQYSAITGSGVNGSANYGVSFVSPLSRLDFTSETAVSGAYFTNTTYAYLSMLNGDSFAKQFEAGDFFTLTITGLDTSNSETGSVDVSLANGTDLLDEWLWTDLSTLGSVAALEFSLNSSDVGAFGMNTPAYFAIDDLTTVPVPAAVWLFGSGLLGLVTVARRRSSKC